MSDVAIAIEKSSDEMGQIFSGTFRPHTVIGFAVPKSVTLKARRQAGTANRQNVDGSFAQLLPLFPNRVIGSKYVSNSFEEVLVRNCNLKQAVTADVSIRKNEPEDIGHSRRPFLEKAFVDFVFGAVMTSVRRNVLSDAVSIQSERLGFGAYGLNRAAQFLSQFFQIRRGVGASDERYLGVGPCRTTVFIGTATRTGASV